MTLSTLCYLLALAAFFTPPLIRDRFDWSDITTAKISLIPAFIFITLAIVLP